MFKINSSLLASIFILFVASSGFAATFTSVTTGNWDEPATWGETTIIPGVNDDVIIDGDTVYVKYDNVKINNLTLTNASGTGKSQLEIEGNYTVDILGDFNVIAENIAQDIKLMIYETAIVNVSGNMLMDRVASNAQSNKMQLIMYGSGKLFVTGSFDYLFRGSGSELGLDMQFYDNSEFSAGGLSTLEQSGGNYFSFLAYGSAIVTFDSLNLIASGGNTMSLNVSGGADLNITNDLSITNSGSLKDFKVSVNTGGDLLVGNDVLINNSHTSGKETELEVVGTGSTIDIENDLVFNTTTEQSAILDIGSNGKLSLAGALKRPNKYGVLTMDTNGSFTFDGSNPQTIPRNRFADITNDSLYFTKMILENSSTGGLTLDGDITITSDLNMTDGIIHSSEDSLLIIADGATIQGSSTAYVDGPIVKKGSTGGSSFIFPTGNNGIYAPIEIAAIANAGTEYTAEYIGCPPPVGAVVSPLKLVNQQGHWKLTRNDGAAVGDVALHWDDSGASGLTDISSLVVAYYTLGTGYMSLGKGTTTGGIGSGISGSIQNDIGCPPPVGANLFVIGSTDDAENALPVELVDFRAYKGRDNSKVYLEWKTISEVNSDHFIIEKSYDGITFHEIARKPAAQNSTTIRYYNAIDEEPGKGNNYYRIQEVDQDQFMSFSKMVNVFFNGQEEIPIVYPNPVRDQVSLYSSSLENKTINLKVFDINGKCLSNRAVIAQDGQVLLSANLLNIKNSGIYFLTYEQGGETITVEFFKQ